VGHLVGRSREARNRLAQAIEEESPFVLARAREVADAAAELEAVLGGLVAVGLDAAVRK